MSLCDLTDKKIIVTGASSGIGRASAVLASKLGARVVLCGRDEKRISETSSMLEGSGHSTFLFDIADFEIYPSIFDKIVLDGKKLDGMLHCAGIAEAVPMRIMKYEQIKKIMDINFASFILLTAIYSKKKVFRRRKYCGHLSCKCSLSAKVHEYIRCIKGGYRG